MKPNEVKTITYNVERLRGGFSGEWETLHTFPESFGEEKAKNAFIAIVRGYQNFRFPLYRLNK